MSFGGTIKLLGEKEYRQALANITKDLHTLSGALNEQVQAFAANDKSMLASKATQEQLTAALAKQKETLAKAKAAYAQYDTALQGQKAKHQQLSKEYRNAVLELEKIRKAQGENSTAYKEQEKRVDALGEELAQSTLDMREAKTAMSQLSREISNGEKAVQTTTDELNKLEMELADASSDMDNLGAGAKKAGDSLDNVERGSSKARGALSTLAVTAGNVLATAFNKVANAVTDTFGAAVDRVDTLNSYKRTMEMLGYSAEDVSASQKKLTDGIQGLPTTLPQIVSIQKQYTALTGDIEKSTNLTLALNNAIVGSGASVEDAARAHDHWNSMLSAGKPDAEHWKELMGIMPAQMQQVATAILGAGANAEQLREAWKSGTVSTEQMMNALIKLDSEGVAGVASFSEQAGTAAGGIETSFTNVKTAVTNALGEILNAIGVSNISGALDWIKEKIKSLSGFIKSNVAPVIQSFIDWLQEKIPVVKEKLAPVVDFVKNDVLPPVKTAINWVKNNLPLVTAALVAVGSAVAAWKIVGTVTKIIGVMKNWRAIVNAVKAAQIALNAAMRANLIGIIITAITALVAAFVYLWNTSEGFRNFWIGLWESIKTAVQPVIDWLVEKFNAAWDAIKPYWEQAKKFFEDLWQGIKDGVMPVLDSIGAAFTAAWDLIKTVWDLVSPFFQAIWDAIQSVFGPAQETLGGFFSSAWEVIKAVWDAVAPYFGIIWESIKAMYSVAKETLGGFFTVAWEAIKAVWNTVSGYFKAIWDTIAGIFSVVKSVLTGNWQAAWDGIKGIVNTWVNFFARIWTSIKNVFASVGSWFTGIFSTAWKGIQNIWNKVTDWFTKLFLGVKATIANVVNGFIGIVKTPINGIIDLINGAIRGLNGIKIPDWVPGVGGKGINIPLIPRLAEGGIVDGAMLAMIGEAGAEAVVPLENNTGWIRKVAQEMSVSMRDANAQAAFDTQNLPRLLRDALKDVKVELNGRELGRFVDKTVTTAVYR